MTDPRLSFRHAIAIASALLLAACSSGSITENPPPPPPPPVSITDTLAPISALGSRWTELPSSPVNDNGHFQDAWFINDLEGWVVAINGAVHHTKDGGTTWEQLRPSNSTGAAFFRSVTFVSPTLGWVGDLNHFNSPVPDRSLWETRDGGKTFENISTRISGPAPTGICGLWSVDASTIFGVGRWSGPAVFVRSNDGGATWQSTSLAPMMTGAVDVYFFDRQRGVIAGARGVGNSPAQQVSSRVVIATTSDGGATWTERFVGSKTGYWSWKISFPSPTVGYIATQGPAEDMIVLKTTDGGITWREIELGVKDAGWGSAFISPTTGWITAERAAYETTDGGASWKRSPWPKGQSINRIRLLPSGRGYGTGTRIFAFQ